MNHNYIYIYIYKNKRDLEKKLPKATEETNRGYDKTETMLFPGMKF